MPREKEVTWKATIFFHFRWSSLCLPFPTCLSFPNLLLLSVFWALVFFSLRQLLLSLAASPKRYKQFLGNLITLHFLVSWELHLRVFHYYFISHCQTGQLQTQMKRSFSFIFKSPWRDSDTYGARLSGSRCTELLYQEFLSKTVWSLWFYMLLELNIMKQVAEKKISVTCVSHFNKTLWEKFVQYSHKLLQGMFQERGRKGEGGPKK